MNRVNVASDNEVMCAINGTRLGVAILDSGAEVNAVPECLVSLIMAKDTKAKRSKVNQATVLQFASEQQVDLIVLSTHGRTGLARWVLGSVAEHVVRKAPCPVLTVHPDGRPFATVDTPATATDS